MAASERWERRKGGETIGDRTGKASGQNRSQNFQYFDGRLAVAMDDAHPAVGKLRLRQAEPFRQPFSRRDAEEGSRLASPEHVVLDQDAPQRRFLLNDGGRHRFGTEVEPDA